MANSPYYEAGRYEGQITSQGFVKAKSGNTQFVLRFVVKGKIDPANPDNMFSVPNQYERTVYRALTEKTIEYFFEDMNSLGIEGLESFTELDPSTDGFIDLKGRTADFNCQHEDSEGGKREKWFIARRGAGATKAVESIATSEVKSLDRLFGKHLKKSPAATTPRLAVQQPAVSSAVITDEDIPF